MSKVIHNLLERANPQVLDPVLVQTGGVGSLHLVEVILVGAVELRVRVRGLYDVTENQFRGFRHDGAGEGIALVSPEIMSVSPAATDELLEVGAWVELLVFGRQIVQNLGCRVNTGRGQTEIVVLMVERDCWVGKSRVHTHLSLMFIRTLNIELVEHESNRSGHTYGPEDSFPFAPFAFRAQPWVQNRRFLRHDAVMR